MKNQQINYFFAFLLLMNTVHASDNEYYNEDDYASSQSGRESPEISEEEFQARQGFALFQGLPTNSYHHTSREQMQQEVATFTKGQIDAIRAMNPGLESVSDQEIAKMLKIQSTLSQEEVRKSREQAFYNGVPTYLRNVDPHVIQHARIICEKNSGVSLEDAILTVQFQTQHGFTDDQPERSEEEARAMTPPAPEMDEDAELRAAIEASEALARQEADAEEEFIRQSLAQIALQERHQATLPQAVPAPQPSHQVQPPVGDREALRRARLARFGNPSNSDSK